MTRNSATSLFFKTCGIAGISVALAACGGGSGNDTVQGLDSGAKAPQDSFFAVVLAMVATSSDTSEPQDINAVTPTSVDNAEPSAMGS